ncbi:autophagy-related protein 7 [Phyllosticta capitalensis]
MAKAVQYAPWSSDIELSFYAALASIKVNHDKLDDSSRKVLGLYEIKHDDPPERSCRMQILGSALTTDVTPNEKYFRAEGIIRNVNTNEQFKGLDRSAVLERAGQMIWDAINDGTIFSCPSLLASFTIISFADIKKYKFAYHFAFPAIHSGGAWQQVAEPSKLSSLETTELVETVGTWKRRTENDERQHGFFLAKKTRKSAQADETNEDESNLTWSVNNDKIGYMWEIGYLGQYEQGFFDKTPPDDRYICFADPSTYEENPGWMLRNLLVLIRHRWKLEGVQILCYRDVHKQRDVPRSLIFSIQAPQPAVNAETPSLAPPQSPKMPKVTGWERNEVNKLQSRTVDLAAYMDPTRLADQAVDLNLKLIKWRIAPSIDLEIIKNTKCLLLGAGTLGSYVGRNLLGWGVRQVSFVDNAKVSFSNPVRQPLFDFKDCLAGGAPKAERAAEALKEIYPGVVSAGHVMSVPMAGHPVVDETKTLADFERLKALIDEHDVIFLLMDTRESRWLPTVMGKAAGKIVMNAALGFDTFVVMRQGLKASGPGEEELGCYFCNDVVAPADSLKDATLDQQCTVTRPGIAAIASALLVELLVSIVQHPLRARAPAPTSSAAEAESRAFGGPSSPGTSSSQPFKHPLGLVPHQIRGFLSTFSNLSIKGQPYDCCSACSDSIVERYKAEGWEFVKRALNEKGWVEEVSGLAEVQRRAEELERDGMVEWTDSEDDGNGEGELI